MIPSIVRFLRAALIAVAAVPTLAAAQTMRAVSGSVTDSAGQPVAYVTIDGGRYRTLSNAVGEFRILVPDNEGVDFAARRIGYLPTKFRIEKGVDTTVSVPLQRLAVLLSTQVVRAQQQVRSLEMRGYYERMSDAERGALVGEFVTPEEVEMRNPQRVTQLLEQRRGITVRRMGRCQNVATCFYVMGTGGCAATVYLDGQRLNRLASAANDVTQAPALDELVSVTAVSGIEVYPRGQSAPAKYQGLSGTCAIIVIWTK